MFKWVLSILAIVFSLTIYGLVTAGFVIPAIALIGVLGVWVLGACIYRLWVDGDGLPLFMLVFFSAWMLTHDLF